MSLSFLEIFSNHHSCGDFQPSEQWSLDDDTVKVIGGIRKTSPSIVC